MGELIKMVLCTFILMREEGSVRLMRATIQQEILDKPKDTLKLAVPAVLYFIQNMCMQISAANLPAAVFQVSYQGKTLVTAFLSVIMLQKRLTLVQWCARHPPPHPPTPLVGW